MKLRNKRTGEMQELTVTLTGDIVIEQDGERIAEISSLAELNEEWEDVPEEYWYIDYDGGILCGESENSSAEKMMISMGNHFETIEEAEKAVEKLKAWKRLKDKGFTEVFSIEYKNVICGGTAVGFKLLVDDKEVLKDLKIIFGGEE